LKKLIQTLLALIIYSNSILVGHAKSLELRTDSLIDSFEVQNEIIHITTTTGLGVTAEKSEGGILVNSPDFPEPYLCQVGRDSPESNINASETISPEELDCVGVISGEPPKKEDCLIIFLAILLPVAGLIAMILTR